MRMMTMDRSIPEPVRQWMLSVDDPWKACERADWFIHVARHRGCTPRHVVQALARNMPPLRAPPDLRAMTEAIRELIAQCASGEHPSSALEARLRVEVRPRLTGWNVARQYHGQSVPEGIPRPATASEEPVRTSANAALRLRKALDVDGSGDDVWAPLVLVAHYIVFERAGSGRNPLYNHVEAAPLSTSEAETHRHLCDALRAELSAGMSG